MAFKRKANTGHVGQHGAVPCRDNTDFLALDRPAGGLYPHHLATLTLYANDLAVLQNIHTQAIGRTGKTPGYGVMSGNTCAWLERCPHHGIAQGGRCVHDRHHFLDLCRIQNHAINPIEPVGINTAIDIPHVLQGVPHIHHASLTEHGVVVQVLRQAFP